MSDSVQEVVETVGKLSDHEKVVLPSDNEIDDISDSSSNGDDDDDNDDDSSEDEDDSLQANNEEDGDDDEEVVSTQPIMSKHELVEEPVPQLPCDYKVPDSAKITLVGNIKSVFDGNNIIVASLTSGEQRVLKEGSVLCLQDKTVVGTIVEVFGQLHSPMYRIIVSDTTKKWNEELGKEIFAVNKDAHWVDTFELKKYKGTDASNGYDEELPESEQEFSDDEKEALAKKLKKQKKQRATDKPAKISKPTYPSMKPPIGMKPHTISNMPVSSYKSRSSRQNEQQRMPSSLPQNVVHPNAQPFNQMYSPPAYATPPPMPPIPQYMNQGYYQMPLMPQQQPIMPPPMQQMYYGNFHNQQMMVPQQPYTPQLSLQNMAPRPNSVGQVLAPQADQENEDSDTQY